MKVPREERGKCLPRTLDSLDADYLRFQASGKGDIRRAKEYNNVIGRFFFNIPPSQVSNLCMYIVKLHYTILNCRYVHLDYTLPWVSSIVCGACWKKNAISLTWN